MFHIQLEFRKSSLKLESKFYIFDHFMGYIDILTKVFDIF